MINEVTVEAFGVVALGDVPNAATLAQRGLLFRDKSRAMRYAANLNRKLGAAMFGIRRVLLNATREALKEVP